MHTLRLATLALATFVGLSAGYQDQARPLLAKYRGKLRCPPGLYETHAKLCKALANVDVETIRTLCLPGAVRIETKPRKKSVEYGQAINLPFAKTRFSPLILRLRQEGSDCLLVNTGTSHLRYVETRAHGWLLYAYGDKPIK